MLTISFAKSSSNLCLTFSSTVKTRSEAMRKYWALRGQASAKSVGNRPNT